MPFLEGTWVSSLTVAVRSFAVCVVVEIVGDLGEAFVCVSRKYIYSYNLPSHKPVDMSATVFCQPRSQLITICGTFMSVYRIDVL